MEHPPAQNVYDGVTAVVEYDYKGKEIDELDLSKGDIIHNIIQQPGGWWEGTLASSGKTGMFPDNFVRILDKNENNTVILRDKSATVQRRCKAIYSYAQVNEDELTLAVGDVIEFLGEVEEGWWRGKLNNKIGVFPSNFVSIIQMSPVFASKRPSTDINKSSPVNKSVTSSYKSTASSLTKSQNQSKDALSSNKSIDISNDTYIPPVLPPRPVREYCRVEFPYSPQNDDELELVVGEIITIINKELPDKGWWKGEINGKAGVFPDNFVKLLPSDESPMKESRTDSVAKTSTKKNANSTSRLESFGSRDSLDDILNETGIQTGNVAAQRKSLENKNFEHLAPSASIDRTSKYLDLKSGETRKSIENLDEKKPPPPLLTKKPAVPGKKSTTGVTNVAGNLLSGLRQKVKNVEQKLSVSQDANDGGSSSKFNLEPLDTNEKINSLDKLTDGDSDFDKVERASILPDMRAGRVKAPKRRPPSVSVATNLQIENSSKNSVYLNGDDDTTIEEPTTSPLPTASIDEQVKPKSREWKKKKVPWMDELKASQVKKKTSPFIEPRTTLADTPAKVSIDEKQTNSAILTNCKNSKSFDNTITMSSQVLVTKSSTILHQSMTKESDVIKSISDVTISKATGKDSVTVTDDNDIKSTLPQNLPSLSTKISFNRMQTTQQLPQAKPSSTSIIVDKDEPLSDAITTSEGLNTNDIEKRIQSLETIVQAQQKTIDDLQKMLREESMRVELLKNQLEKYAQCVTQV